MQPLTAATHHAWGTLRTFSDAELAGLPLSDSTAHTLQDPGLPEKIELLFTASQLALMQLPHNEQAIAFGHAWNDEYTLCITGEQVHAVYDSEVTFVNSSLPLFLTFLARASELQKAYHQAETGALEAGRYRQEVDQTMNGLRKADPPALADKAWWRGVLDDFKLV